MGFLTQITVGHANQTITPIAEPTGTGLRDLVLTAGHQDPATARLLRSLLAENQELRAANNELSAMLEQHTPAHSNPWSLTRDWFAGRLDWPRPTETPTPAGAISWQDIHRQDTSGLPRRPMPRPSAPVPAPLSASLGKAELGWLRQNTGIVYLLRAGQWQSAPSSPPDAWAKNLATRSGVTRQAACQVLKTAFDTIPLPSKGVLRQPPSEEERKWVRQNSAVVQGLASGELRAIPASPIRGWITAFQDAVGGTMVEISGILAIVIDMARRPSPEAAPA